VKALIFDSGTLINLSMNGLLYLLERLKEKFDGKFLITRAVKYETIDRPLNILRFELGALRVQALIDSGVLELPEAIGVSDDYLKKETPRLMNDANHILSSDGRWLRIVSEAEVSCLALSEELSRKKIENLIAIDERTTRMLSEKPENLERIMEKKLHMHVEVQGETKEFSKFRFIRSSEIVYVAYKKGLLGIEGKKALEAALYATKFHGAAISFEEIDVLKKL
jgi:hypothetical protein